MMKKAVLPALIILFLAGQIHDLAGQEALRMPEAVMVFGKAGTVNHLLSRSGRQLPQPWVVFADRDAGDLRMGEKVYVVGEKETELHLCRASASDGRILVGPRDLGWHPKSELLVRFGAEFTGQTLIHKRCAVLNHGKTIDRIRKCEISESGIPLYRSPWEITAADTLPLYLVFYVYKSENNRYLLGAGSRFDQSAPFDGQVIGRVARDRVFDMPTRVVLEPACEEKAQGNGNPQHCWPPQKFRFPLLGMADPDSDRVIAGMIGRYAHNDQARQQLCETLRKNRSQVDIFFILDHTIDCNRLAYVIGQIEQEYTGLGKRFGVRFFPAPSPQGGLLMIGDTGEASYRSARDFILDYRDTVAAAAGTSDILTSLGEVLDSRPFAAGHTNILVLVNDHAVRPPDSALQRRIRDRLVENNCYLLVFDYRHDNTLVEQAGALSMAAAKKQAGDLGLEPRDYRFHRTAIGYELAHAGVLSILEQSDTGQLAALQMQNFLQKGYAKIITNMQNTLELVCRNDDSPVIRNNIHEEPFETPLQEIPGMEGRVRYIRAVENGSVSLSPSSPHKTKYPPACKAEISISPSELKFLAAVLEKALADSAERRFPVALYTMWEDLFNRFCGETLPETELLQLTPRNITSRMLGISYELIPTDPVKRYPMERLLAAGPELAPWLPGYRQRLEGCLNGIRQLLDGELKPFSFADGEAGLRFAGRSSTVYWLPVDIFP